MASALVLAAALLASAPTPDQPADPPAKAKRAKKPKPSPEERLAKVDDARVELHLGIRGYGRHLGGPSAYGGSAQLGVGVRVVRGLYLAGELGAGAHWAPFGAAGQVFVGLRHELRFAKWVRPSYSLGYAHLIDATFNNEAALFGGCGCPHDFEVGFDGDSDVRIAQRSGVQAGLGLRFPFKWAPRLSAYVRADGAYYFDREPGRLQVGVGGGVQVVF